MDRLKPDPIPVIHPVAEAEAEGALKAVYERTKTGFGVPWMGVVAMCFAHYPTFYARLWSAMEPVVGTAKFARTCTALRDDAEARAAALGPTALLPALSEVGYHAKDIEDIRTVNEIFSAGNMPYLLMATLARRLLEGHAWDGPAPADEAFTVAGAHHPVPVLIEQHHANNDLSALYADIRTTLGLPFVNTDYRAFARWPSYLGQAWADLAPHVPTDAYQNAVTGVHETANALATTLPNPTGLTPDVLTDAARQDATHDEVLSVVRLFQWLLPGLATNVAFFRAQLQG